jgi:hypothetical protein
MVMKVSAPIRSTDMIEGARSLRDASTRPKENGAQKERRGCSITPPWRSTNLIADLATAAPGLAPETRDDIPRLAHLLEALQEGFDPLRRNLDDGPRQAQIMRVFWTHGALTVGELLERLAADPPLA